MDNVISGVVHGDGSGPNWEVLDQYESGCLFCSITYDTFGYGILYHYFSKNEFV